MKNIMYFDDNDDDNIIDISSSNSCSSKQSNKEYLLYVNILATFIIEMINVAYNIELFLDKYFVWLLYFFLFFIFLKQIILHFNGWKHRL